MVTKYIINNATRQIINGNITINGNLTVTGSSITKIATYKALLTQTESISGSNLEAFNNGLIIGETYTINNYFTGDDFSNIANVISGNINETNCQFIATGDTPNLWFYGSQLTSAGNLVVDVLENNLDYQINWESNSRGVYFGFLNIIGSQYNTFPRKNTSVVTQQNFIVINSDYNDLKYYVGVNSFNTKDDVILLQVWDTNLNDTVSGFLYYTPIEINLLLDTDTTPIVISGTVVNSYPFSYASVRLYCNNNIIGSYIGDNTVVNNLTELITELNTNQETSFLGTYSEGVSGGVLLTTTRNKVNRFCTNGTLTFEIFAD